MIAFSQEATCTQYVEQVPIQIDVDCNTCREIVEVPIEKIVEVPYTVEKIVQVCHFIYIYIPPSPPTAQVPFERIVQVPVEKIVDRIVKVDI